MSLVIVDRVQDWPIDVDGVQVVRAKDYLTRPEWHGPHPGVVFNLSRSYGYQTLGYYVSLLAEARGHRVRPGVRAMRDFGREVRLRTVGEGLDALVQKALARLRSDHFELSIYFGRPVAARYEALARALAEQFEAPLLRARFIRVTRTVDGKRRGVRWELEHIGPIAAKAIPEHHREDVLAAATEWLARRPKPPRKRRPARCTLAIVHDPDEALPPSDDRALRRFLKAARELDVAAERITPNERNRLLEFDAVFLRVTTGVDHWTYRWARDAERAGAVVIDDPVSILRCTNKVFLEELLHRHRIATPRSVIVHKGNRADVIERVGLPCVLKSPDGSFSQGVHKASSAAELHGHLDRLLACSELVLAQEWLPTDFDWRIGVLGGRPLFAARYWMRGGHWQIVHRSKSGRTTSGRVEAVALDSVPARVLRAAVRAAGRIGNGLYGVDLKEIGRRVVVIEVNDNPNIDGGQEDGVEGARLYGTVVEELASRVEARRFAGAPR
jgi:glutathione synthase/RimK-type ligase-like ATP-grasp enzyme